MHCNLYHLKSNKMFPRERVFDISFSPWVKNVTWKWPKMSNPPRYALSPHHGALHCHWWIDLFHKGGLRIYYFLWIIISLSDLVDMCKIENNYTFKRDKKEYINKPPLWKRSITHDFTVAFIKLETKQKPGANSPPHSTLEVQTMKSVHPLW